MMAKPGETTEEFVERLASDDLITLQDAGEILSFDRFLKMVGALPAGDDGKRTIPVEWGPYVKGTGPAP